MVMLVPDIPQYVAPPPYVSAHVEVVTAHNWDLGKLRPESVVIQKAEPLTKPGQTPKVVPVDYTVCLDAQKIVQFSTDQYAVSSAVLKETLGLLPKQCIWSAIGFTDPRGSASYNESLGMARARWVTYWLQNKGYTTQPAKSYGKQFLISTKRAEFSKDRRVELTGKAPVTPTELDLK